VAWTYDPTLFQSTTPGQYPGSTQGDRYQIRFLIQDTISTRPLMQDEELDWLDTVESNVWMAAAAACESLVARSAGVQNRKVGDLSLTYDPKFYRELAVSLRARGAGNQVPYFGGQSISDKIATESNPDAVVPAFAVGLDENPAAPRPAVISPSPLTSVPH